MADDIERYLTEDEVRVAGRRLSGIAIKYGATSASHRERFEPGSLRLDDQVILDWEHNQLVALAWTPGGGLELVDGPDEMRMVAELPPLPAADKALEEVRAGRVSGLSVRFRPVRERRENGIRIIEEALLRGIAITRAPSYQDSRVEARSRRRKIWL